MNVESEFKTVNLWLKKACGSEQTRRGYLQKFIKFSQFCDFNPNELIEQWKKVRYEWKERQQFIDTWTENIENYIYNELDDLAPLSKQQIAYSIISFFQHNKIPIEDVDMPKNPYVKYHNRDITKKEIRRILEHSRIREKTFYLMMIESGLRPDTLLKLKYRNIKEEFESRTIPMKIDIPQAILKDKVGHRFSFIGEDGYNALKEYLSTRQQLNDDDLIFLKEKHRKGKGKMTGSAMSNIFRDIALKLGLTEKAEYGKPKSIRMYNLRKYFRNNIRVMDTSYREFWMGHKFGTDEHYLTRNVDRHREVYAEAYPSLRIYEKATKEVKQLNEELEKTKEELETLRKQVKHLSSTEYVDKRFKQLMKEAMEKLRKENPQWNE